MRFLRTLFLLVLMVVVLVGAAVWFLGLRPYGPGTETFVEIAPGTGSVGIAEKLEQAGIIRSRYAFEAVRALKGGKLKAGEYRFANPETVSGVYARIARGDVYTRTLVIPEGFNIFDIAQAAQTAGLGNAADFLAAEQRDTRLIADLSPQATSLEGYLFPDTYRFQRHATPDQMVARMVERFRQIAAGLHLEAKPATADLVTMASLIEKEVRRWIASGRWWVGSL